MKLKKLFALLLCASMILSVLPMTSLAGILSVAGETVNEWKQQTGGILTTVGSTFRNNTTANESDSNTGNIVLKPSSVFSTTTYDTETPVDTTPASNQTTWDGDDSGTTPSAANLSWTNNNTNTGNPDEEMKKATGLETSKTVSGPDTNGNYTITLESYVTGNQKIEVATKTKPMDIILVLDRSGQMKDGKMNQLQTAVKGFLEGVVKVSPDSRVAIVSYGTESTVDSASNGEPTEDALLPITGSDRTTLNSALTTALESAIEGYAERADAYSNKGMANAAKIFQDVDDKNSNNATQRMVVFFTTGIPGKYAENRIWKDDACSTAMNTIVWSQILKNKSRGQTTDISTSYNEYFVSISNGKPNDDFYDTESNWGEKKYDYRNGCDAEVYCVGIAVGNCNATDNGHSNHSGSSSCSANKTNEYLYRVSSYRSDGSHVGCNADGSGILDMHSYHTVKFEKKNDWESKQDCWYGRYFNQYTRYYEGSEVQKNGGKPYYQAGNIGNVSGMFKTIVSEGVTGGATNTTLNSSTVLKDVVSEYFTIPNGASSVKVYTADCSGMDTDGKPTFGTRTETSGVTAEVEGNTVTVTGFDYSANWCGNHSGHYEGKKLVVEITIKARDGFLGGNDVPTNVHSDSGIYTGENDGALVANFPSDGAKADVAIPNITVSAADKNIYLSNTLTDGQLVAGATVKIGEAVTLDLSKEDFGLKSWQTAYLSSISLSATGLTDWTEDGTYTVTCTVTPKDKTGGTGVGNGTGNGSAKINVFKPYLTYKDSTIYLGNSANYSDNEPENVVWKHISVAKPTKMDGNEPELTVTYDKESGAFTECTDVKATKVTLGGEDGYLNDTTFVGKKDDGTIFTVHVVKPVATFQDSAIYLGNEPNYETDNIVKDGSSYKIDWTHTKNDGTNPNATGTVPTVSFEFNPTSDDSTDCTTVTATVKSNNVVSAQPENQNKFTVHVLKPVLSVKDVTIYQGQTQELKECVEIATEGWKDYNASESGHGSTENIVGTKPTIDNCTFTFEKKDSTGTISDGKLKPEECTEVEVTGVTVGGKSPVVTGEQLSKYFGDQELKFTVHVLKPTFTVTTQDLWADYGTAVDLFSSESGKINAVSKVESSWAYTGTDCTGHSGTYLSNAPTIAVTDVVFAKADTGTNTGTLSNGEYTMGTADGTVTVSEVKYTNSAKTDATLTAEVKDGGDVKVNYGKDDNTDKTCVTLHVNKFDLVIEKNWKDGTTDADKIYKQDAVFTVTHNPGTGATSLNSVQVVLPSNGDGTVKVTGLLCGQEYTITEDSGWTWRWTSDGAKTVEASKTKHTTVSTSDPHSGTAGTVHGTEKNGNTETVTFTNTLLNRLWLSFCTFVRNVFGNGEGIQKGGTN